MRGTPSDNSSRNAIGSLPWSLAISSMKLSAANALWPLPTPRQGDTRAPRASITCSASLFGIGYCGIGEPFITMRSCRGRRIAGRIGHHRFGDHAVVPGDHLAVGVEARLDVMRRHRAELAEGDVVLAAPDQLDRLADRLGETDRIERRLMVPAPAVTAAEKLLVQGDLRALDLEQLRDRVQQPARRLGAGPDLGRLAVGADRGGRVHRLHLGVIDVARAVFAAIHLGGACHRGLGVAVLGIDDPGAALVAADGGELLERALAVVVSARRIRPGDLEQVLGGLRALDRVADDADTFRQLHHVGDARHLAGGRIVHGLRRAARIGRLQHRGVDHAGHLHVHAVLRGAGDLERHLDPRHVLADQAEARRVLEILLVDLGQLGRSLARRPRSRRS